MHNPCISACVWRCIPGFFLPLCNIDNIAKRELTNQAQTIRERILLRIVDAKVVQNQLEISQDSGF